MILSIGVVYLLTCDVLSSPNIVHHNNFQEPMLISTMRIDMGRGLHLLLFHVDDIFLKICYFKIDVKWLEDWCCM